MLKQVLLLCLMAPLLMSCANNGRAIEKINVIDTACSWVKPIYISKDDQLTDGTARQILSNNRAYMSSCKLNNDTIQATPLKK